MPDMAHGGQFKNVVVVSSGHLSVMDGCFCLRQAMAKTWPVEGSHGL